MPEGVISYVEKSLPNSTCGSRPSIRTLLKTILSAFNGSGLPSGFCIPGPPLPKPLGPPTGGGPPFPKKLSISSAFRASSLAPGAVPP